MASISSSSSTCYHSPSLMNLSMSSLDESSLSWREISPNQSMPITYVRSKWDGHSWCTDASIAIPKRECMKVSELVLMCLQELYAVCKSGLQTITSSPSTIYINLDINLYRGDRFKEFQADITVGRLANAVKLELYSDQDHNQAEEAIFGLKCSNARKTIQLADQLLTSLLKQEEREIAYWEFSDITNRLTSLAQEAANTNVQKAVNTHEIDLQKTCTLSRLNFLSHSLTLFKTHFFRDQDLCGRITIAMESLPISFDHIVVKLILEYGDSEYRYSKNINSKRSIHSSSSNSITLNPSQSTNRENQSNET